MKDLLLDQSGHLASNQYCRRCGYNLRGLNFEAVCPECELSISKSLRGDSLNFADPAWVKRLHRGMIWIVTGAILSAMMVTIGPVFISFVVVGFGTGAGAGAGPPAGFNSMLTGFAILSLAVSAILFFGVWLVTTPDPATEQRESPLSARRLARWCSLAIAMASPLSLLQQQIAPPLSGGVLGIVFGMIGALVQIVSIVAVFAGFIYLASIARRMHARTLATQTNIAGWGYGITSGLVGVSTAMILMFMPAGGMGPGVMGGGGMNAGPGSQVGQLLFIGFCCGGPLVIIFAVWYIVVLICYLSPLSGAVAAAQAWQSEIGHAQPQRNSMPVDSAAADADTT